MDNDRTMDDVKTVDTSMMEEANTAKSKILVLVEGQKTDPKLMKHLLDTYGISQSHEIVSYNTNIYTLYNEMFRDGDPDSMDILQILKEREKDESVRTLLNQRFSDILLIFDLDPQDPLYAPEKVISMMQYFVESSDMGKLYLNYPMVESFYHMKSIPDEDYNSYTVSLAELVAKQYKARVNRENRDHDYNKFAVNKQECDTVIRQNIEKAVLVADLHDNINVEDADLVLPDSTDILTAQLDTLSKEGFLSVLCTCVFYIVDYNPNLIE